MQSLQRRGSLRQGGERRRTVARMRNCAIRGPVRYGRTSHADRLLPVDGVITKGSAVLHGLEAIRQQRSETKWR